MRSPEPPSPADVAVPGDPGALVAPRYGTASLADLVPAVHAHLRGERRTPLLADLATDRVVVLVVDGLGSRQLARTPDVAPLLRRLPGDDVDAVFPTTTVASLASIGTGEPPSRHGLVGYAFALPDRDQPLNALGWRIGLRGGGFDARATVVPETLHPDPTALEAAAADGIAVTVVVDDDLPDSGLTRAVLRGGNRVTASGLQTTLDTAVAAASTADGPALVYCHHPLVDWAGHSAGACSPEWCDAVSDVDAALTALRRHLPRDVTVLVTADHGMLTIPDDEITELSDHPGLLDGVRVLAGEPRVRHLALEEAADPTAVAARWRAALGERALVLDRATALPLFGPDPAPAARRHVGDLVVLARRGTLVHERVDPHGGRLPGMHGGLTRAERLVPLRRLVAA